MDQKSYPNLNPKMKETYDRIMGTSGSKPTMTQTTKTTTPAATAEKPAAAPPQVTHASTGHLSHIAYNASMGIKPDKTEKKTPTPTTTAATAEKKDSLLFPIIIAAVAVVFFVVYSVFWMNFFGLGS